MQTLTEASLQTMRGCHKREFAADILLFAQLTASGFRHTLIVKRAVPAPIATAVPALQVVLFCKHHIALLIVVKVFALNQVHGQIPIVLKFRQQPELLRAN